MAEGLVRTPGTAGPLADGESQPARRESLRIVILDHQPGGFRLHNLAACPEELAQERGHVRRGSVRTTPGRTQLPPVRTVPVPPFGLRVTGPRFRRGPVTLAGNHLVQFEAPESLSRVVHA